MKNAILTLVAIDITVLTGVLVAFVLHMIKTDRATSAQDATNRYWAAKTREEERRAYEDMISAGVIKRGDGY